MASRSEFLEHLWRKDINSYLNESWIDSEVSKSHRYPTAPFADFGLLLARLLELGVTRRELSLFARAIAYQGAFNTLYAFEEPGLDQSSAGSLHESILSADPSGMEGRPESFPSNVD